jgi:uncharacterized protein
MSQKDVQVLRGGYETFNRGDIPAVVRDVFDAQIEWYEPGGGGSPVGTFNGSQRVANEVFATIPQSFDEFRADAEQFIDAGENVVVVGRFRGRAKSGAAVDVPFAHVWEMKNGKATRFANHVESAGWSTAWGG